MRQTGVESIAETSAERESRRDETQKGSAGRDESRAPAETKAEHPGRDESRTPRQRRKQNTPAETKHVSKERRKTREKPRAMTA